MPYLTCGYENDFISKIKSEIKITYLARDYDQYCFQFSNKGFFAFKEQIPKILSVIFKNQIINYLFLSLDPFIDLTR